MNSGDLILSEVDRASLYVGESVKLLRLDDISEEDALHRVAREANLGFWTCWGLFRGRRKKVSGTEVGKLKDAYLACCSTVITRLQKRIDQARGDEVEDADLQDIAGRLKILALEVQEAMEKGAS